MFAGENMNFKELIAAIVAQLNGTVTYLNSQSQELDAENDTAVDDYGP